MTKKAEEKTNTTTGNSPPAGSADKKNPKCGIIRPIAPTEGYSSNHWNEVGEILSEAILAAGFEPRIVSDADNVAVIHGTIVQNIYEDSIIVCDVSSRNPNVMFELGMRLAFDKPVVIVKDDATNYAFDTGVIEHISYPKSLHYHEIGIFKEKLRIKIISTIEKAKEQGYSPFLKHFRNVSITPQKLQNEDIPLAEFVVDKLETLESKINRIASQTLNPYAAIKPSSRTTYRLASKIPTSVVEQLTSIIDKNSVLTQKNGEIYITGSITSEQFKHLYNAIKMLELDAPLEMVQDTLRHELVGESINKNPNMLYRYLKETPTAGE